MWNVKRNKEDFHYEVGSCEVFLECRQLSFGLLSTVDKETKLPLSASSAPLLRGKGYLNRILKLAYIINS
jgi:hypothetical protein